MYITCEQFKRLNESDRHEYIVSNFPATIKSTRARGPVYGVGVNDAEYTTCPKLGPRQVMCPAYTMWKNMISRCYGADSLRKYPSYSGVRVCDEWLVYSNFLLWWRANQVNGHQLDKDLLSDSRVYSPETCLFVPGWLNTFTVKPKRTRGGVKTGAYWDVSKGGWRSSIKGPFNDLGKNSPVFNSQEEAHLDWKRKKLEYALRLKPEMDRIDLRIYPRVVWMVEAPEGIPVMWRAPIAT